MSGPRYSVKPFKESWAVMEGDRLVTRTATEEAAREYAGRIQGLPEAQRPTSTPVAPVDTSTPPQPVPVLPLKVR